MNNNITSVLTTTLSSTGLWSAILSTIGIITLGYLLVKIKVFKAEWSKVLNSIVLKVALPALAFSGFMNNATIQQLTEQGIVLGVSFGFYILLSCISILWVNFFPKLLPNKIKKLNANTFEGQVNVVSNEQNLEANNAIAEDNQKRALTMWMMLIFGSTTFFGLPIIRILYGTTSDAVVAANIWNIPYRIFLYSFAFLVMSGLKFDKQNIKSSAKTALLNPIVIATFLGLVFWLTQLIPGASRFGANFTEGTNGWFNWNVTMPYFYTPINTVGSLSSPLVWLSIGITLATTKLIDAVKDKWVWIFSVQKLVIIPFIVFIVFLGLVAAGVVTRNVSTAMVIFAATPPATVVIAYAMQYKVCDKLATQCSALTTLLAIIAIPIWIIICTVVYQLV
ncbi:malate permease [Malacoplasma penetrans]|nr:AEC family transporter [Malacoplasma penetrans]RXY96700.1 malate permease [Malacoplasma penetrans]